MTTHRYLFDEHVHSFYPTLAERIGLPGTLDKSHQIGYTEIVE